MELLEIVVMDEADRLLEMGFKEECLQILKFCKGGRQTLLFSATLNDQILDLAVLSLNRPVRVTANPTMKVARTVHQVSHDELRAGRRKINGKRQYILLSYRISISQAGKIGYFTWIYTMLLTYLRCC